MLDFLRETLQLSSNVQELTAEAILTAMFVLYDIALGRIILLYMMKLRRMLGLRKYF